MVEFQLFKALFLVAINGSRSCVPKIREVETEAICQEYEIACVWNQLEHF